MKKCSLDDFMQELNPWLDRDHIRSAHLDDNNHLVIHFVDGMKNVYNIDDCNREQVEAVLHKIQKRNIQVL